MQWTYLGRNLSICFLFLQEMSVGYANGIRVMSMTHTGEPGFMLYIPIEVRLPSGLWGARLWQSKAYQATTYKNQTNTEGPASAHG